MKENDLTQGGVVKTLIAFNVPFLIANILQSLYGAVDLLVSAASATRAAWPPSPPARR